MVNRGFKGMSEPLNERIILALRQVAGLYHRLVLLVGPPGSGKTATLTDVAVSLKVPLFNVSLEMSKRMLEMTDRQRALMASGVLDQIASSLGDTVLLDNIEILFGTDLRLDPLRLLQSVSRNRTVVAAWPGTVGGGCLQYAANGHPECRRYPLYDLVIIDTQNEG
jgi:hypothetical protein